jgi:hypothetical protein
MYLNSIIYMIAIHMQNIRNISDMCIIKFKVDYRWLLWDTNLICNTRIEQCNKNNFTNCLVLAKQSKITQNEMFLKTVQKTILHSKTNNMEFNGNTLQCWLYPWSSKNCSMAAKKFIQQEICVPFILNFEVFIFLIISELWADYFFRPLTCFQSDDTRCCINTFWPPDDEHDIARNM